MSRTPERTCVGCRRRGAKTDLLRIVAEVRDGRLVLVPDPRGRAGGRGAHLHPDPDCLALALRRRAFPRAFRTAPGTITAGLDSDQLTQHVEQWAEQHTQTEREEDGAAAHEHSMSTSR